MSYNLNEIQGWMAVGELEWLYQQAEKMVNIAEIGCWKGRSTHALLSGCKGTVYAVDTWKGSSNEIGSAHREATERDIYVDFMNNLKDFPNLRPMRMPSVEAAKHFPAKSIDMVFIDGCHLYDEVLADLHAWLPKTRRLICGHDASQDGVPAATQKVFGTILLAGSIWYIWLDDR